MLYSGARPLHESWCVLHSTVAIKGIRRVPQLVSSGDKCFVYAHQVPLSSRERIARPEGADQLPGDWAAQLNPRVRAVRPNSNIASCAQHRRSSLSGRCNVSGTWQRRRRRCGETGLQRCRRPHAGGCGALQGGVLRPDAAAGGGGGGLARPVQRNVRQHRPLVWRSMPALQRRIAQVV
jgi:hypothetical protein